MSDPPPDTVPIALSTVQTEDTFKLSRYESTVFDRSFYLGPYANRNLRDAVTKFYDVDQIVQFLLRNEQFRNITLQFPDNLVQDSSLVTQLLQDGLVISEENSKTTKRKIWVLADTAYSACCVDEVASEHVKGDIVIHFGDACLNSIKSLPVLYSFGKPYLDLDVVAQKFKETYADKDVNICLMADAPNSYNMKQLCTMLKADGYNKIVYASIDASLVNDNCTILQEDIHQSGSKKLLTLCNKSIYSLNDQTESIYEPCLQENYDLFHITVPADPHLLFLTTKFRSVSLYDPITTDVSQGPFPSLLKRYKFMHVARTAGCIGILVNTLSLKNTKETINTLIKHIRESGKKHYLFVVGKPNVAKLANFDAVDVWCILGCGQGGIILDQHNEFYKPIITPYELTMALKYEVTWTGQWVVDFRTVLNEIENEYDSITENSDGHDSDVFKNKEGEEDAPEFDAVTGKYVSTSRPLRRLQHLEIEGPETGSKDLVKSVVGGLIIKGTVSTSAAQLQSREWKGLGSDFSAHTEFDETGAIVEEGISGVASGYEFDRDNTY